MQGEFDAVIVGAGHNALACAAHLGRRGWRAAVFEQAARAGGAIKTLELTESGFRHDWGAMNLSLFAGSAFFRAYGDDLARHGLEFAPVSDCFASVFEDGRWLGVSTDRDATRARIAAFSERDAAAWEDMLAGFGDAAESLFGLLSSPMKKRALAAFLWRTLRRRGLAGTQDLARFLLASPRQYLNERFETPQMRALLAAWGMHLDFAPDIAGGALFPYLEGMANQSFGMVLGRGGADTVTHALQAMVEESGGVVQCDAPVRRVLREGGRAIGVELSDGTRVAARRAVIAGTAPGALVDQLLEGESGDARFDAGLRNFAHAPGTMMLHLALDALPQWRADAALQRFAYVHIAPSLDQMARTYAQAQAGLLPDAPVIVVGQPGTVDPSRAPEGKHTLWVQVRMVPADIRGDAGGTIDARDWDAAAEPMAARVMDIIERHAPGVRAQVIAKRVVTPPQLEADNPNLVGGDQVCGSHHLAQHFLFRPLRGHADGRTPVKGLHLVGAGVWPGAGVGAGSGYLLGRALAGG